MKTVKLQATLDAEGRLRLDVPIGDGPQEVDVVLVVSPHDAAARQADWEAVAACLGALPLTEDPALWQRSVRSEWAG